MKGLTQADANQAREIIAVTGGAGFIGSHVCERLIKLGYTVICIDNFNNYYDPEIKRNNIKEIQQLLIRHDIGQNKFIVYDCDIRDHKKIDEIFKTYAIKIVIHLAAYAGVRPSIEKPGLYMDVNVNGTVNILECMKKYNINKIVFGSSSSVYGNNHKVPFSEDDVVDTPISPYAASKKACELVCYTYHHLYDFNIACLRFFTVYGPRQRPDLAIHKFTKLLFEEKPIPFYGDGSSERDYTYIADILDGIIKSMNWVCSREKKYGIFNLGESKTISLKKMVEILETKTGKKANLQRLPYQPGDVQKTYADITKSKQILGYDPKTKFEEGLDIFIEWYKLHIIK